MTAIFNGLFGVIARKNVAAGGGVSPGTSMWNGWYDFNNTTPGDGRLDATANSYDLTSTATPTYVTTGPEYVVYGETAYDSSSALGGVWCASDGDWTAVARFKGAGINDKVFSNTARHAMTWGSGVITTRIGAGVTVSYTHANTYSGVWVTAIAQHDTSANETRIYFLNENGTAADATVTGDWNTGTMNISEAAGLVDIDFVAFGNRLLTEDERLWFGNNSSEAKQWSDL